MSDFNGQTSKPLRLISNLSIIDDVRQFTTTPRAAPKKKLCRTYADSSGRNRSVGLKKELKESAAYPRDFGNAMFQVARRNASLIATNAGPMSSGGDDFDWSPALLLSV
eukprot:11196852-Lingulodinium_polyedra.AAC.1